MNHAQAMQGLSTCDLCDACDALGITAVSTGTVKAVHAGCKPICGPITTCHMSPTGGTEIVLGTIGALLAAAPGSIFLVCADERMELNTIGSLVAVVAMQARLAGAVVDGCVRDVQGMQELGFSTYARGTVVPSVRGRMAIESVNESVPFAGAHVMPGWICAADANGVIVFPPEREREIFALAWRAVALDEKMFQQILQGGDPIALHKAMKYDLSMGEQLRDRSLQA